MQKFISTIAAVTVLWLSAGAQTLSKETVLLETPYGSMRIKLYEETPLHKANFLKLVREHFYDSLMFHRVIQNFMIQGGDPLSRRARPGDSLGHGDIGYTVPAEFRPALIHKKGMLCAARESDDINPERASSGSQFYIVQGKQRSEEDMKKYEERINKMNLNRAKIVYLNSAEGKMLTQQQLRLEREGKGDSAKVIAGTLEQNVQQQFARETPKQFTKEQREIYRTIGGTPHLDGSYTVFGEVIQGLDVLDKIAAVKTDKRDRPLEDVRMTMRLEEKKK